MPDINALITLELAAGKSSWPIRELAVAAIGQQNPTVTSI